MIPLAFSLKIGRNVSSRNPERAKRYPTSGIPTEYAGVHFRSRLEATWARFFNLCGWQWDYEPIDLPGYIPDFVLYGERTILVDVKPVLTCADLMQRAKSIADVCADHDVLVLGAGLIPSTAFGAQCVGVVSERMGPDGELIFDRAVLMTCRECGAKSFFHESLRWDSRMCGHYDGAHFIGDFPDAIDVWNQAKNGAQWKAVKPIQRLEVRRA